jgi:hypothetical protein
VHVCFCVEYDVGNWNSARNRAGFGMPVGQGIGEEEAEETSGTGALWVIHVVSCDAISPPSLGLKGRVEGRVNGITGGWSV